MSLNRRILAIITGLMLVAMVPFGIWYRFLRPQKTCIMTVFVHGSIFSGLAFLNKQEAQNDTVDTSGWYYARLKYIRKKEILSEDQMLLGEGLEQIPECFCHSFDTATDGKKAPHLLGPIYEKHMSLFQKYDYHAYYTFGHSGFMNQAYRRNMAAQLYQEVCDAVKEKKREFDTVKLQILSHSHGSNIALNLGFEEERCRRKLVVDDLISFGGPVQVENAVQAFHPMFKRVLNIYSDGDWVQPYDNVSTRGGKSYRTFNDPELGIVVPKKHNVFDIHITVNNKQSIDHINLWFVGRSAKASSTLWPLPVMVLTPFIQSLVNKQTQGQKLTCNIVDMKNQFTLQLLDQDRVCAETDNLCSMITKHKEYIRRYWNPTEKQSNMVFSKKNFSLLAEYAWHSLKNLFN